MQATSADIKSLYGQRLMQVNRSVPSRSSMAPGAESWTSSIRPSKTDPHISSNSVISSNSPGKEGGQC